MPGLPARLVRRDGKIISLDCTDYMLQVQRKVSPFSLPFTGERVGADLNLVATSIRLNVVLRDDNCAEMATDATRAISAVDFSMKEPDLMAEAVSIRRFMESDSPDAGGQIERADLDGAVLNISARALNGSATDLKITLQDATGAHTGFSDDLPTMILNMQTANSNPTIAILPPAPTGSQVAAFLQAYIANNTTFAALVTATVEATVRDTGSEKGLLRIINVHTGAWSEQSPVFTVAGTAASTGQATNPAITTFSGGGVQDCFSAGDKVQNLLGAVANNTILGGVGGVFGSDKSLGGNLPTNLDALGDEDDPTYESDYIVGLQLPYNSFTGVTAGSTAEAPPQAYAAKNFIYATGFNEGDKGAVANTLDASGPFSVRNKYTGVRGTVTAIEFKYNAGETVYEGSITFSPMDSIMGI